MGASSMNQKKYSLTFPQKSIWDIENFRQGTAYSNLAATFYFEKSLDPELLEQSINLVIEQNDALRIKLIRTRNEVQQYISGYKPIKLQRFSFSFNDLSAWEEEQTRSPFMLYDSELVYFAYIRLNEDKDAFFLKIHHLIADTWSITLLLRNILHCYEKFEKGESISVEEKPSYVDFILDDIAYCDSDRFRERQQFWKGKFSSVPQCTSIRPGKLTNNMKADRSTFKLDYDLTQEMKRFCKEHKVSEFIVLFTVLTLYISRITSTSDIVIGAPVLNRSNAKRKNTLGMFISYVPFRITLKEDWDFKTYLTIATKEWRQILKNQRFPYSLILKDFREKHQTTQNLIDISMSFQNATFGIEHHEFSSKWHFNGNEINSLTIHINDRETTGSLILDYAYLLDVFTYEDILQMHNGLTNVLRNSIRNPSERIPKIQLPSDEEFTQLLDFNSTQLAIPEQVTIHQLFEAQVKINPNGIALSCKQESLTFETLNRRSNQLARILRARGVHQDDIVGVMVNRSFEMLVSILAVLKAGGAYLPIDPSYPLERIQYILTDSQCQMMLGKPELVSTLCLDLECIDVKNPSTYTGDDTNLTNETGSSNLAYVIYTSGSTGKPKGVMIEHRSIVNFIYAITDQIDFSREKTVASLTTISFDIFVLETLLPLTKGLRVVISTEEEQITPSLISRLIVEHRIDILQLTPSRLQLLLRDKDSSKCLRNLSEILIGGEPLSETLLYNLKQLSNAKIYNMYGPTETTVWSTIQELTDRPHVDIGKPIGNTQIYILDQNMELVAPGVNGEIFIGGYGLARGYFNRPNLTDERFVSNPFVDGEMLYRSGDCARWKPDGSIEYIGRNDYQVKIRGYRIELGEIENCLLGHEKVLEAVVVCHVDKNEKMYLYAFFTGRKECSELELANFLSTHLPSYMIPARFVWLNTMPMTPNGKVNRGVLLELEAPLEQLETNVQPTNSIEMELVRIWTEVLDKENIGIDNNFFKLGGDSLSIVEILTVLLPHNYRLSAQDFYDYPTVRLLAVKIMGNCVIRPMEIDERNYSEVKQFNSHPYITSRNATTIKNVLLTGATGFLGMHVIWELLQIPNLFVYCLIRGDESKFLNLFEFYFSAKIKNMINRVKILKGDICNHSLGLSEVDYKSLGLTIDTVIHTAGLVKHYGEYKEFENVNVKGTQNVVDFCLEFNKSLNHVSTVSVSGNRLIVANGKTSFTEDDLYIGQNFNENVYVRSKFEAENHVIGAMSRGLQATILRVGVLTGRVSDGVFQKNIKDNAFYNKLKSMLALNAIPSYQEDEQFEFTPVDSCAKALVKIVTTGGRGIFHLFNEKKVLMVDLVAMLSIIGWKVTVLSSMNFEEHVKDMADNIPNREWLNGLILDLNVQVDSVLKINVDSQRTIAYLSKNGFEWPKIDVAYLDKNIHYMQAVGFLNINGNTKRSTEFG